MFLLDPGARSDDPVADASAEVHADADANVETIGEPADDIVESDEEGPGVPRIRGLGLMHDPNDLAMGMIVAIGLIGGVWRPRPELRSALLIAAAGALVYGIYLTRSRGGAVALVVVLWRFTATRLGRVPALVLLAVLATGALAVDYGGRSIAVQDESASERVVAWTEGLEMLKSQPILGVGYGQFLDHHTLTAHNSLVLCFAETGLVGCFFWVALLVVTAIELHGVSRLPGDEPFDHAARQWAEGLQLALIGFLTAAFFLSRTFVPILYLLVGLSAALAAIARNEQRSIPLPALPQLGTLVLACELASIAVVYTIVKLNVLS
jgi:O-antigen ligase